MAWWLNGMSDVGEMTWWLIGRMPCWSNGMLVQWDVGPVTCQLNGPFNRTIYTPVFEHQGGLVVYMKHCPLSQVIMLQGIYSPVKWHGA